MEGKISLITGAASGIGAATAALFARRGGQVILSDIDDRRGLAVLAEIRADGGDAEYLRLDVANPDQ